MTRKTPTKIGMMVPSPALKRPTVSVKPTVAIGKPNSRNASSRGIDRQSLGYRARRAGMNGVPAVGMLVMIQACRPAGLPGILLPPQSTVGLSPPPAGESPCSQLLTDVSKRLFGETPPLVLVSIGDTHPVPERHAATRWFPQPRP